MKEFGEKIKGIEYSKRPGSYGVIIKDNRIVVVKSSGYNTYFLVGGGIDEGEGERETLRREATEEIGFQIEVQDKIGEAIEYFFSKTEEKYTIKQCHFYRVSLQNKTEEGKHELAWITGDELDRMHHESYRWILEREIKLISE